MIDLDKLKMGHFILWMNEGTFVGNTIRDAQLKKGFSKHDSEFVHIDVSGGGPFSVRVNPPKTKVVDIRKTYPGRRFMVVRYNEATYEAKLRYKVAFWASSNCNLGYDFWGIVRFKIPFLWHKKYQYFCSENSLWALQKACPFAIPELKPEDCMPADFMNPRDFTPVYGGRV